MWNLLCLSVAKVQLFSHNAKYYDTFLKKPRKIPTQELRGVNICIFLRDFSSSHECPS